MEKRTGFTIEVTSRYDDWWRYNVALMGGCFDREEQRIGFVSASSHVAEVGANLSARPDNIARHRTATLTTEACDHLVLYLYIIPHTLPVGNDIDSTKPFNIELRVSYAGKLISHEKRTINQWSGASIEMRIENR